MACRAEKEEKFEFSIKLDKVLMLIFNHQLNSEGIISPEWNLESPSCYTSSIIDMIGALVDFFLFLCLCLLRYLISPQYS